MAVGQNQWYHFGVGGLGGWGGGVPFLKLPTSGRDPLWPPQKERCDKWQLHGASRLAANATANVEVWHIGLPVLELPPLLSGLSQTDCKGIGKMRLHRLALSSLAALSS